MDASHLTPPIASSALALVPLADEPSAKSTTMSPVSETPQDATAALSAQNLSLFLGKDRKQNSACDACRVRKVKCVRTEDDSTCTFCISKNVECTRYYMAMATEASQRRAASKKRKRHSTAGLTVDTSFVDTPSLRGRSRSHNDLREGTIVQVRSHEKGVPWEATPHRIHRIVYRPVAVVLDSEDAAPIGIDHVRAFEMAAESTSPLTPALSSDALSSYSSSVASHSPLATPSYFTESFTAPPQRPAADYAVPPHAYAQEWQEPSYVAYSPSMASVASQASGMVYSPYMAQPSGYFGAQHPANAPSYPPTSSSMYGSQLDDGQLAYCRSELRAPAQMFHVMA